MDPRIEYAKAEDGASIACTAIGQGPAVVIAGGIAGDLTSYSCDAQPLVDHFVAAGHRIILYDQRGTGASDRDFGRSTPDTRLSDLESVVKRMVDGPFALIGRSTLDRLRSRMPPGTAIESRTSWAWTPTSAEPTITQPRPIRGLSGR